MTTYNIKLIINDGRYDTTLTVEEDLTDWGKAETYFNQVCEEVERGEFQPADYTIDYTYEEVTVDLEECTTDEDGDEDEVTCEVVESETYAPRVESIENCILVTYSTSPQPRIQEISVGFAGDDTSELARGYVQTDIIFDADDALRFESADELREAIIKELQSPRWNFSNRDHARAILSRSDDFDAFIEWNYGNK